MGKRAKLKKQIDTFTHADDINDEIKSLKNKKFSAQEQNKRERSLQKEMVRKIQNIVDSDSNEETGHTNKVIYTIKPVI